MAYHRKTILGDRHPVHNYEYTDVAEMEAATGPFSADEIGCWALLADGTYYRLSDNDPPTWEVATGAITMGDIDDAVAAEALIRGNADDALAATIALAVSLAGVETITGAKTFNDGKLILAGSTSGSVVLHAAAVAGTGVLTLPAGTDTLVGKATTDTLTNKTLTAPTINGGTATALTGLSVRSTGAAFNLTVASSEVLTAGRTLSIVLGDAARTLTIGASASVSGTNTGDQTLNGLLPTQTSNSGKYLTTDGTNASWATVSGGGGSGTVSSGTAGRLAYYASTGTTIVETVFPGFSFSGTNNLSSYTPYNMLLHPFAKTDATQRNSLVLASNDASNPFCFIVSMTGNATSTSRTIDLIATHIGLDSNPTLQYKANQHKFYTDTVGGTTLSLTINTTGIASQNIAATGPVSAYYLNVGGGAQPGGLGVSRLAIDHSAAGNVSRFFSYGSGTSTAGKVEMYSYSSNESVGGLFFYCDASGNLELRPRSTGYWHVGASAYATGAYSVYNSIQYPFAKSDTTSRNALFLCSNDASNPFGLDIAITGNGTAASRIVNLQLTEIGVNGSGRMLFTATSVEPQTNVFKVTGASYPAITIDATAGAPALSLQLNTSTKLTLGIPSGINEFFTGTSAGDVAILAQTGNVKIATNNVLAATFDTSGNLVMVGGLKGGTPSGGTAAFWKPGSLVTASVTPDVTRYVQLDVGGTLYKLIVST